MIVVIVLFYINIYTCIFTIYNCIVIQKKKKIIIIQNNITSTNLLLLILCYIYVCLDSFAHLEIEREKAMLQMIVFLKRF